MSEQVQQPEIKKVRPVDSLRSAVLLGKEVEGAQYGLSLFLGSLSEQHEAIFETAVIFARLSQMRTDQAQGIEVPLHLINSAEVKYNELKEKHFGEVDQEDLGKMLISYFSFVKHRRDNFLSKDEYKEYLNPDNFVNTVPQVKMGQMPLIAARAAKAEKAATLRDRMRSSVMKVNGTPDSFTILLMNSIIMIRIKTPTNWEVVSLINRIALKLQGASYGTRYRMNSLHLERALISKVLVEWILERTTYWSVDDIASSDELLTVIDKADLNILSTAILGLASPKGVPYRLHCLANNCNYQEDMMIDAKELTVLDHTRYPESYWEMISAIVNTGKRYTIQELKDARVPYIGHDGKEIENKVTVEDGSIVLGLSSPYLSEYFSVYETVAEFLNKEIRELAVQFPNDKEFAEKRKELQSSFRLIDYVQYFESYTRKGDPLNEDEKDEVILRSEDPAQFVQGLIDMFNEDEDLYANAISQVLKSVPKMSYTFTGIMDDECPSCKKRVSENVQEINNGFTPIDPILNFFDQARTIVMRRKDIGQYQEELLS